MQFLNMTALPKNMAAMISGQTILTGVFFYQILSRIQARVQELYAEHKRNRNLNISSLVIGDGPITIEVLEAVKTPFCCVKRSYTDDNGTRMYWVVFKKMEAVKLIRENPTNTYTIGKDPKLYAQILNVEGSTLPQPYLTTTDSQQTEQDRVVRKIGKNKIFPVFTLVDGSLDVRIARVCWKHTQVPHHVSARESRTFTFSVKVNGCKGNVGVFCDHDGTIFTISGQKYKHVQVYFNDRKVFGLNLQVTYRVRDARFPGIGQDSRPQEGIGVGNRYNRNRKPCIKVEEVPASSKW